MAKSKTYYCTRCIAQAVVIMIASVWCIPTAQAQDTLQRRTLMEVSIIENKVPTITNVSTPTQVITMERLERQGMVQLSDAVRQMAGITLKDYGGVGGVKTISARGLGSQFSGLVVDGVAVNDCQNGQIDLGRYLLGNTAFVSHSNGQQHELLQTARAFAMGSMVQMASKVPSFYPFRKTNLRLGIEGGSFGYWSPQVLWEQQLGKRAALSVWSNFLTSQGNYPFTLPYGMQEGDSTSRERRTNSQVKIGTLDANLYLPIGERSQWHTKVHYVRSYHALPGPVIYYTVKESEHSEEELMFVQSQYKHRFSERWSLLVTGKVQQSLDVYEDTAAMNANHFTHNDYLQREGYLSAAAKWSVRKDLDVSLATDGVVNSMQSNLEHNNVVERLSNLSVLAVSFHRQRVEIDGNVLATLVKEEASTNGKEGRNCSYKKLSPYAGLTYTLAEGLRLRYFFKQTYRIPTINEMYYFTMTRDLKPEKAQQHNLGLTYTKGSYEKRELYGMATLDGYVNRVSDKLIAVPTNNMFLWSMMNLGLVDIVGADFTASISWCEHPDSNGVRLSLLGNYSYQHAVDHTDPLQKIYGHQIAYTPRHSGNLTATCTTQWGEVCYTLQWVGQRYYKAQNKPEYLLPSYADHGIALSKTVDLPLGELIVRMQVQNLLDVQYEVVRSYPMMGRNWKASIVWNF